MTAVLLALNPISDDPNYGHIDLGKDGKTIVIFFKQGHIARVVPTEEFLEKDFKRELPTVDNANVTVSFEPVTLFKIEYVTIEFFGNRALVSKHSLKVHVERCLAAL